MTKSNEESKDAVSKEVTPKPPLDAPSPDIPKSLSKPATGRLPSLAPPKPSLAQPVPLQKPGSSPSGAYPASGAFSKVPSSPVLSAVQPNSGAFAKAPGSAPKVLAVTRPASSTSLSQAPDAAKQMTSGAFAKAPSDLSKTNASGGFAKVPPTKLNTPTASISGAHAKVPDSAPKALAVTRPDSASKAIAVAKPASPASLSQVSSEGAKSSGGAAKIYNDLSKSGAFAKPPSSGNVAAVVKPISSSSVAAVARPASPVSLAAQPEAPSPTHDEAVKASITAQPEEAPPVKSSEAIAPAEAQRPQEALPIKSPTDELQTGPSPIEDSGKIEIPPEPPSRSKEEIKREEDFFRLDAASLMRDGNEAGDDELDPLPIPIKKPPTTSSFLSNAPQVIPEGLILDSRYRLLKMLGEGGMGAVYKAEHLLMRKPVAIKILKKEAAVDRDLVMRFIREAQLASKLSNPHCVTIHDFGQTPDRDLYLVMELIEGEVLRDIMIEEGRVSVERAYWVMVQLLEALGAAHDIGVIHRDVKPENIMLVKDPTRESGTIAKLLDFGIARPSSPVATGVTRSGFTVGTPGYIAPEQALGRTLDGRTDLYAAAVIFYEMICGRRPYLGNSAMEIITNQVSQPPPRPSQVTPEAKIPMAIEDVLLKALAKEPDKRYLNAKELRLALEKAMEKSGKGQSIVASEPTQHAPHHHDDKVSDDELLRVAGHRKGSALIAGLLGGLLIGASGVAGYFLFASTSSPRSSNATLSIPIAVDTTHHFDPQEAKGLFTKGDLLGAASALNALSKKDRSTPEVQTLLAVIHSQLNNWSEARAAIRLARFFGPFSTEHVPTLLRNATLAQTTKDAASARVAVAELGADALKEILSMLQSPDDGTKKAAYTLLLAIDEPEAPLVENVRAALEQNETCNERQTLLRGLTAVPNPAAADDLDIVEKETRLFCVKASTQPAKKP